MTTAYSSEITDNFFEGKLQSKKNKNRLFPSNCYKIFTVLKFQDKS